MRAFLAIRRRLGVSQVQLAAALHCTQSNVSYYERGQTVPPDVAKLLIAFAATHGLQLSYDHVYGDAALPRVVAPAGS
jgi:putative transcriptional regulator